MQTHMRSQRRHGRCVSFVIPAIVTGTSSSFASMPGPVQVPDVSAAFRTLRQHIRMHKLPRLVHRLHLLLA